MKIVEKTCLWDRLKTSSKPILLFGLGDGGDKIISALKQYGISINGVFCSDDLYREKYFHGFKVMKYSTAKEIFKDMIVLMSFGSNKDDVIAIAKSIAKEQEFYVPDVPVFGKGLFNTEFFNIHKEELEQVYLKLADTKSKLVFENVINYKLSGNPQYLYSCETDNYEAFASVLNLGKEESFLDLGAYDGDTVHEFIEYTGGKYKYITAVEPDKKNFKKLLSSTKGISNLKLINAAVSSKTGSAVFECKGGRSSYLTSEGNEHVDLISVDSLDFEFTYIKIDVEGNELKTLAGAKKTLAQQKPKLLVSAYHRNEDMFTIPQAVLNANPDYKIYMRHYKYLPAWDTNFYFV